MNQEVDIFAPVTDLGKGDALEAWRWLVGKNASIRLLTAMGDIFFVRRQGIFNRERVYFLDTGAGQVELASKSWKSFRAMITTMDSVPGHWFKYRLLVELSDQSLTEGCCFSPKKPPILGGCYKKENYNPVSWAVHVDLSGQLHEQIKDLPSGTPINSISLEVQE
ncbi:T6SS immunity protein Tdi1 domain-containing protein [Microbulbifer taiwanensis]|uniref:T6SS immunity protein Tdi1 domain-containing protein n=1 Tax=Microbulbifer taiwanensis TaxID=986746 RepID=A0ABW1YSD1_9GAMM|nr:T6SS immunity protein Tdi1 domain-containing protein [Microbulbifer taiwanensis]